MLSKNNIEWKVRAVKGFELESVLNELTSTDHEIFTVQFSNDLWTIIAKKFVPESSTKTMMGFKPRE